MDIIKILKNILVWFFIIVPMFLFSHGVQTGDQGYIQEINGVNFIPFMYLGAKHMVTGYDHLLFLVGVIFFLYRLKDIGIYVSLFALGHSSTLLLGVFADIHINAFIIDAIIGLSVVYKALDNLGAFLQWFGVQPNTKISTFIFGLFHGFELDTNGLFTNLIAFNFGVELGQLLALSVILILISYWRKQSGFLIHAYSANVLLMTLGFMLTGYQLFGYFNS